MSRLGAQYCFEAYHGAEFRKQWKRKYLKSKRPRDKKDVDLTPYVISPVNRIDPITQEFNKFMKMERLG